MKTPNPNKFPRYIRMEDGSTMLVHNQEQMSAYLGREYDEHAELVVKAEAEPPVDPPSEEDISELFKKD